MALAAALCLLVVLAAAVAYRLATHRVSRTAAA